MELVRLFESRRDGSAEPTEHFGGEARSIQGISEALGRGPDMLMRIIMAKARTDEIASRSSGPNNGTYNDAADVARIESNEMLTRVLFSGDAPEAGLRKWIDWHGSSTSGRQGDPA